MKIFVLCGIPGSGKSTLAEKLAIKFDAKIHSYDRYPNSDKCDKSEEIFHLIWNNIRNDLKNDYNVVCDCLHTTKQRRQNILNAISDIDCEKILVVMNTPLDECIKRNANRKARLPVFILYSEYKNYQPPSLDEGWNDIFYDIDLV